MTPPAMHEINIKTLQDEATRLIDLEIDLLQRMLDEGIIANATKGESQTFDTESAYKCMEMLLGEKTKLENLEMVLAVVGTMKAGKSTTINAIVGTEVLPNRNRPMTAIPTLIRHTPGEKEPVLHFKNDKPINELLGTLYHAVDNQDNYEVINTLCIDSDMNELVNAIKGRETYERIYRGADSIFSFLKGLNDLVRLSRELGVEFPFSDYDEMHELPVIEVEFSHLRELDQASGRLTLLDTPGPNESGQPHLRKMLREQLRKASAVLAVMDYTQLKSDADAEVRNELEQIAEITEGRIFTLVNKFDQKDSNSDSEDDVKRYVSEVLMSGRISSSNVFPVSSRWAYLSNRAKHEIDLHQILPDSKEQLWVSDFGCAAFGTRWESKIKDVEQVMDAANDLWDDSLFHIPLESVVQSAHARAAAFSIDAAAAKLVDIAQSTNNLLSVRASSLKSSAKELQKQISALQADVGRIAEMQSYARNETDKLLNQLNKDTTKVFSVMQAEISSALQTYFKEGKRLEKAALIKKNDQTVVPRKENSANSHDRSSFIGKVLNVLSRVGEQIRYAPDGRDFDPENPVIKFDAKKDSRKLLDDINKSIATIINSSEKPLKTDIELLVKSFQENFIDRVQEDARNILKEINYRLDENGFNVKLKTPKTNSLILKFSGSEMLDDMIEAREKTVTKSRRQSGAWGTVCDWFNTDDWGWENYQSTEEYFEVDIRKIQRKVLEQAQNAFAGFDVAINDYIKIPLNDGIEEFFQELESAVEKIRGDMLQGIRDHAKNKEEKLIFAQQLSAIQKYLPNVLRDTSALKDDVAPLVNYEVGK